MSHFFHDGPAPSAHPECTSARHTWIREFEQGAAWQESENRPWGNKGNRKTFGCVGEDFVFSDPRLHLRFFWNESEQFCAGVVHWQMNCEGPPGSAHGASIATVFDEILAHPVWRNGVGAFTGNLSVDYRRRVPVGSTQRFEARVVKREGRKLFTAGRITSPDGATVYAESTAIFVQAPGLSEISSASSTDAPTTSGSQPQVAKAKL